MKFVRSTVAALMFVALPAMSRAATTQWRTVVDQHGSSVKVPISILKKLPDPAGLRFETPDGKVAISVSTTTEARPDFPGHNPKDDMSLKRADCDAWPPKYLKVSEDTASYSCVKRGNVTYYLARYGQWGSVVLLVTYPTTGRSLWDHYVRRMARSLKQVERHEVR
jgi:hypothetical protein